MNESLSIECFVNTTDEDQQNYFFGAFQMDVPACGSEKQSLPPGNYRVIDGKL